MSKPNITPRIIPIGAPGLAAEADSGKSPQLTEHVAAGFPSPADDYIDSPLDLNRHLIRHPSATFFVRVEGDSMTGAGIFNGDILVVDRSLEAEDKKIVIAIVDGELTVRRLRRQKSGISLAPENNNYQPIHIEHDGDLEIWGVVTTVLHSV